MRIFFTIAFLLNAIGAMACEYAIISPIEYKDDLKKYDFVALVKVENTAPINPDLHQRTNGDIKIHINELFKGTAISSINVSDFIDPCGIAYPQKGDQLLIFGIRRNGKIQTGTCVCYKIVTDKPDLSTFGGMGHLKSLRRIYRITH